MQVSTFNGSQPVTTRLRNVSSTSFEFQIQEWDYLDGYHQSETLTYLVIEGGSYELPSGLKIQAGKTDVSSVASVHYPEIFNQVPVVLSQIQTVRDSKAAITRNKSIDTND